MAIPFKYNLRNLHVRWVTALMTIVGIAAVTGIFVTIFALGVGMERTLVATGHPLNVVVLRPGAQTETNSSISKKQADDVAGFPGIAPGEDGQPLISPETIVIANLPKGDGGKANLTIRGVGVLARALRDRLSITEGRWFNPNLGELVVGKGAKARFAGLALGDEPFIRGRRWKVVGVFEADGQVYESEIWAHGDDVREQFKREYSSVIVRCTSESAAEGLIATLKEDKNIRLEGKRHPEYYKDQNMGALMLKAMGVVMAIVLSIGAIFGAANTMFAAVASRTREIATMRVFGFSRLAIWVSFMFEAALLGVVGGCLGSIGSYLLVNGYTTGTVNWQTFSELAFQFRVTPGLMGAGVVLAVLMGVGGGFLPAWRAARVTIAQALRGL